MRLTAQTRRLIAIAYGLVLFVWLQVDDNNAVAVAVLGGGLALLLTLDKLGPRLLPRHPLIGAAALGVIAGVGGTLATAGLMVLKTGLHGYDFPDYPPGEMLAMLQRAPVWGLAGALAGIGLVLAYKALRPQP